MKDTPAIMEGLSALGNAVRTGSRVAMKLLANGMNPGALRTNATLRKDEWKELDTAVVQISRQRLVGVQDLISRGLVYNVGNALGTTVLQYEDASDMSDAVMSMDGAVATDRDRMEFDINSLPLPLTHKGFTLSARVLAASRTLGQSLDVTQAQIATRKVAELVENTLFNGASTYTYGGGTIYGYTDHPNRNQYTLTAAWDASSTTGTNILDDVRAMKQMAIDAYHFGPWVLYVPTDYETALDDDFKAESDKTIRQRILEISGIQDVKVADKLATTNVVLAEMAAESARMVVGMQPAPVEWETEGGMLLHFKVMAILVPQIRADQDGNCGIVHGSE